MQKMNALNFIIPIFSLCLPSQVFAADSKSALAAAAAKMSATSSTPAALAVEAAAVEGSKRVAFLQHQLYVVGEWINAGRRNGTGIKTYHNNYMGELEGNIAKNGSSLAQVESDIQVLERQAQNAAGRMEREAASELNRQLLLLRAEKQTLELEQKTLTRLRSIFKMDSTTTASHKLQQDALIALRGSLGETFEAEKTAVLKVVDPKNAAGLAKGAKVGTELVELTEAEAKTWRGLNQAEKEAFVLSKGKSLGSLSAGKTVFVVTGAAAGLAGGIFATYMYMKDGVKEVNDANGKAKIEAIVDDLIDEGELRLNTHPKH